MESTIISHIDAQIAKLQTARNMLADEPKTGNGHVPQPASEIHMMPHVRRTMSPEVRAKMSAAAKLRWERRRRNKAA